MYTIHLHNVLCISVDGEFQLSQLGHLVEHGLAICLQFYQNSMSNTEGLRCKCLQPRVPGVTNSGSLGKFCYYNNTIPAFLVKLTVNFIDRIVLCQTVS